MNWIAVSWRSFRKKNLTPAERIGEQVGLSASAVQRRTKRLREAGVIVGDVSLISPKAVGQGALFIVEVSLERENAEVLENFKRRMRATEEVQQCYYITGDADFLLVVSAPNIAEYERLCVANSKFCA